MLTTQTEKITVSPLGLSISGELTFDEWSALAPQIGSALRSMAFVIGDWLAYGEEHFVQQPLPGMEDFCTERATKIKSDRYEAARAATGIDKATLKNYAYVSRRVPMSLRNELLSWEHHKAVAKLDEPKQLEWLAAAARLDDRLTVRRLRASIISGRILSPEELSIPPAEQGITNHIPYINRLCGWWKHIDGPQWIKGRTREQIAALLRDFEPVATIINKLRANAKD